MDLAAVSTGAQFILVEVPVITGAIVAVAGYLVRRYMENLANRLQIQDEALGEQSRALAVLVAESPRFEKRLTVVEERLTGLRETTSALRAAVALSAKTAPGTDLDVR